MKRRRSGWIWAGRIVAVMAVVAGAIYFIFVGLAEASSIAGILSLFVAVVALVGPPLLSSGSPGGTVVPPPPDPQEADRRKAVPAPAPGPVPATGFAPAPALVGTSGPVPVAPSGTAGKDAWIEAVMAFADIADPAFRQAILRDTGERLGLPGSFPVPYRALARDHVVEMVQACWDYQDPDAARAALAGALMSMRPYSAAAVGLRRLLGGG